MGARTLLTSNLTPGLLESEELGLVVRWQVLSAFVLVLVVDFAAGRVDAPGSRVGLGGDVELSSRGPDLLVVQVGEEPFVCRVARVEDRCQDET